MFPVITRQADAGKGALSAIPAKADSNGRYKMKGIGHIE
jgi:hypothetical protein